MKHPKAWLPAMAWMGFIFLMSAAPGDVSGEQSGLLLRIVLAAYSALFGGAQMSPEILDLIHTLIRKAAHMSEYAVLALSFLYALRKNEAKRPLVTALLLSALYAATDEIHQAFVPDRGPSPIDVMIDTAGAAIGLALHGLACRIRYKHPGTRSF